MVKMPLVEHVMLFHPSISLHNVLVIGCQHILATTHLMFRSLYDRGLDPKNIFLLGKCYSSNRSVWKEMQRDGINVSPLSFYFENTQSFDNQFCRIVAQFLEHTLSQVDLSKFYKIILIDDGGQLLSLSMKLFKGCPNIVGIEQTTSGYEKLKSNVLQFPVINVARSQAKLIYESPMIAETVVKKTIRHMATLKRTSPNVLIMGNGALGSSIYNVLKNNYDVEVYDNKLASQEDLELEGYLQKADLIIGCTGNTSIPVSKHPFLKKGCILFSASSSDREFDAVHIRRKSDKPKNCHATIKANGLTLLNCGFPINFDGGKHSVAPSKIQLTRALLAAAMFQAYETIESALEIVPLDIEIQRDIISNYLKLYPPLLTKSQSIPIKKYCSLFKKYVRRQA